MERAAALWGGRTAVSDEHESLSYAELRERSRRAASAIMAASAGRAPVMVWLPKSAAMLTGFNAAMYAGRPYVPTDAAAPVERLRKIISNLHPSAVVTNAELAAKLEGVDTGGAPVLLLDELTGHAEDAAAAARKGQREGISPAAAAMARPYTGHSGSSRNPRRTCFSARVAAA